jgi:hypothetical protein
VITIVPGAGAPASNWEDAGGTASGTDLVFSVPSVGVFGNGGPDLAYQGIGNIGGAQTYPGPTPAAGTYTSQLILVYNYTIPPPPNGLPEPGTWALVFASASVSLVGLRRRRALKK